MCVFIFILWLIIDVNFFNLFKNNWKNPNKYFKSKNVILYLKMIVVIKSYLEHFCCCSHWDPCQLIFRLEVAANESAQVLSLYQVHGHPPGTNWWAGVEVAVLSLAGVVLSPALSRLRLRLWKSSVKISPSCLFLSSAASSLSARAPSRGQAGIARGSEESGGRQMTE